MSVPREPQGQIADIARQARALLGQVRQSRWSGFAPPAVRSTPQPNGGPANQPRGRPSHRLAPASSHTSLPPATPAGSSPVPAEPSPWGTLEEIAQAVATCTKCPLHASRRNSVAGEGDAKARLMFVGEAPGAEEDRLGRPFVGAAGQLLDKMIAAMGLAREQVFIANVLKCRPPGNRDPQEHEVAACLPYLRAQIALIRPAALCSLGRHASQALLERTDPLGSLRGRFFTYRDTPLMPTYHPSYLLRSPAEKTAAWKDLQQIMRLLGLQQPGHGPSEESTR